MNIDERVEISILVKYYGKLLTKKQLEILSMYVDNNLSLAEVSSELSISRQAVKDALDKAEDALRSFEKQLKFVARDLKLKSTVLGANIDEKTKQKLLKILEG